MIPPISISKKKKVRYFAKKKKKMSTLPHLPTLLRKTFALTQNSKNSPKAQISNSSLSQTLPSVNQNSNLAPLSATPNIPKTAQQVDSETQNQLIELQSLRDMSVKRYELNIYKIRSIDRNFNLNVKKIEQINARAIARVTDRISAYASEVCGRKFPASP